MSVPIESLGLEPTIDWAADMRKTWTPGEPGARSQLKRFLSAAATDYESGRDRPDRDGTSRLSPYLHFGEISAREVWHCVRAWALDGDARVVSQAESYLRELAWREFAHHLLFHFPNTTVQPLRKAFESFQWVEDAKGFMAWQRGCTGYPFVDAGMRQLWATGWMHNRVRMLVASFLVKDLMISWSEGTRWFWDTLVDADLANNTLGWQWSAGCGADAVPYFRVFNPITQGRKFDPDGSYVRKWVPELSKLPTRWIHRPWEAPEGEMFRAGVTLGKTYPFPIIDHAERRKLALQAFQSLKAPAC
jgi:deoxyribodipyrimidine photo-lyase